MAAQGTPTEFVFRSEEMQINPFRKVVDCLFGRSRCNFINNNLWTAVRSLYAKVLEVLTVSAPFAQCRRLDFDLNRIEIVEILAFCKTIERCYCRKNVTL